MALKFFSIRVFEADSACKALNLFLGSNRVLNVDKRFVDAGLNSFWSICVDYLETSSGSRQTDDSKQRSRVDYREVLAPDQFATFVKLRELRREIAQTEAVPVYTIFTNEQLGAMVSESVTTREQMAQISGVGESRLEKYATRFLEILARPHEAG